MALGLDQIMASPATGGTDPNALLMQFLLQQIADKKEVPLADLLPQDISGDIFKSIFVDDSGPQNMLQRIRDLIAGNRSDSDSHYYTAIQNKRAQQLIETQRADQLKQQKDALKKLGLVPNSPKGTPQQNSSYPNYPMPGTPNKTGNYTNPTKPYAGKLPTIPNSPIAPNSPNTGGLLPLLGPDTKLGKAWKKQDPLKDLKDLANVTKDPKVADPPSGPLVADPNGAYTDTHLSPIGKKKKKTIWEQWTEPVYDKHISKPITPKQQAKQITDYQNNLLFGDSKKKILDNNTNLLPWMGADWNAQNWSGMKLPNTDLLAQTRANALKLANQSDANYLQQKQAKNLRDMQDSYLNQLSGTSPASQSPNLKRGGNMPPIRYNSQGMPKPYSQKELDNYRKYGNTDGNFPNTQGSSKPITRPQRPSPQPLIPKEKQMTDKQRETQAAKKYSEMDRWACKTYGKCPPGMKQ